MKRASREHFREKPKQQQLAMLDKLTEHTPNKIVSSVLEFECGLSIETSNILNQAQVSVLGTLKFVGTEVEYLLQLDFMKNPHRRILPIHPKFYLTCMYPCACCLFLISLGHKIPKFRFQRTMSLLTK